MFRKIWLTAFLFLFSLSIINFSMFNSALVKADNVELEDKNIVPYQDLTLVWSDEFDYTGLPDSDKWSYDVGGHGWGNGEKQYYTENKQENARVEDGKLIITARQEEYKGNKYTSARLVTRNKGDWLYGRIEVRAKLPGGRGTWPAIWMLPTNWDYGSWPNSGEIDIMEHVGYDMGIVHGSVHTRSYNHKLGTHKTNTIRVDDADQQFHVYSLEWYPSRIMVFVDDILYFNFANEMSGFKEWPFDQPFHLLLNVAVGGGWGGLKGVDKNIWPQILEVDYVRVYDLNIKQRDKVPPRFASQLKAEPSSLYVKLKWEHASDQFGIKEYKIYSAGKQIGKTQENSFVVNNLKPSTDYFFSVRAVDYAGNTSELQTVETKTLQLPLKKVPGRVEAEDYLLMEEGVATEVADDIGGGVNLCYIGDNDWMEYVLDVKESGRYKAYFRLAGVIEGEIEIRDETGKKMAVIEVPATGDWQEWTTVSSQVFTLKKGINRIKVYATVGGFNFNWFEIKEVD